jgi:two-component system NtrC family response regulator
MIRVICVAHRDIEDMIQTQTFREDLYYRKGDITLELPPLREREDDVLLDY